MLLVRCEWMHASGELEIVGEWVCKSSLKRSKILYSTSVLVFQVRLFCAQFTHNTLCRTVTSFSSRSHEYMNKSRLVVRPIATRFLWMYQWYCPAFTKKGFSHTMNPVDGPYIWMTVGLGTWMPETFSHANWFGEHGFLISMIHLSTCCSQAIANYSTWHRDLGRLHLHIPIYWPACTYAYLLIFFKSLMFSSLTFSPWDTSSFFDTRLPQDFGSSRYIY